NDKAAHTGDRSLCDRAFAEPPAIVSGESLVELAPDAIIGPQRQVFIGCALEIEAADFRRAHGEQCKAAIVMYVDEFFGGGRRLGEDAEPAEGIFTLVNSQDASGNGGTRDPVKAVAAGDEVAVEAL